MKLVNLSLKKWHTLLHKKIKYIKNFVSQNILSYQKFCQKQEFLNGSDI